jgi:uncharacterized protein
MNCSRTASTPDNRKWMILGKASFNLPEYEWQLEAFAFFDHVLKRADNGYEDQPPVRYWIDGADRYQGATFSQFQDARRFGFT